MKSENYDSDNGLSSPGLQAIVVKIWKIGANGLTSTVNQRLITAAPAQHSGGFPLQAGK